jgi:excisionase family DNA binding protein
MTAQNAASIRPTSEVCLDEEVPRERKPRTAIGGGRASRASGTTESTFVDTLRTLVREVIREELNLVRPVPVNSTAHLSTRGAAQRAGVAMGTIRRWIREGKLPERRAGRHLRVRSADVDALLAGEPNGLDASPEDLARQAFGG